MDTVRSPGSRPHTGIFRSPVRSNNPYGSWDGFMKVEREQLAQRAAGKMARMIGRALRGESQEELDLIAIDDQFMAQNGYVPLRQGDRVWHKHIDELTPEDRPARMSMRRRWCCG